KSPYRPAQQPRQMLLIFLSSSASSLFTGSFGLEIFFSSGTSPARGWRCPTGAGGKPPFLVAVEFPPCANAGAPISTRSAIETNTFFMLLLQLQVNRPTLFRGWVQMYVVA